MSISKEKILAKVNVKELLQLCLLFGVIILVPFFLHSQWITGPLVNAILIITWGMLGLRKAMVIALVPSLIALSSGTLPAILAPAVPFIMISNAIYLLTINFIYRNAEDKEKKYWLGILFASAFKFAFLFLSTSFIVKLFDSGTIISKISQMMTWTQFMTALTGGAIAWIILKKLKKI